MIRRRTNSDARHAERGFSLLELMVVLTITALLTALLFPGMRAARDSAQRLICASNMRQLGMATITFSMDQRGEQLPPSRVAQSGRRLDQMALTWHSLGQPSSTHQHGKAENVGPEWDGLGILVRDGYCDSPECLYCPSHTGGHRYEESQTDLSRTMFFPRSKDTIYANYQYLGDDGRNETINTLEPDAILITDGFRTKMDFNHRIGMNQLLGDLSIQWWQDEQNRFFLGLPDSPIESIEEHGEIFNSIWGLVDEDFRIDDETAEN